MQVEALLWQSAAVDGSATMQPGPGTRLLGERSPSARDCSAQETG